MVDFLQARQNMIDGQLRPNRVTDPRLLAAIAELPREQFLPASLRGVAYIDDDIPLGNGRYLIEPMVLCRLVQAAGVKPTDKVLDIACATGYSTALLARLAGQVTALESDAGLAQQAQGHLQAQGIANAKIVIGHLADGCPAEAPYDAIVIGGAVQQVPAAVQGQLAEGGRLVAVFANGNAGTARLMQMIGGAVSSRPLFDAGTPGLPGFERSAQFVF
ncbi:MAG: protein-L-isoaspartate O-methyltransferase [Rhodospirillales bacterium]